MPLADVAAGPSLTDLLRRCRTRSRPRLVDIMYIIEHLGFPPEGSTPAGADDMSGASRRDISDLSPDGVFARFRASWRPWGWRSSAAGPAVVGLVTDGCGRPDVRTRTV